ncbi:Electron transfer flavoprotein beta subunit lysine methyltransferase [Mactra antiquata]
MKLHSSVYRLLKQFVRTKSTIQRIDSRAHLVKKHTILSRDHLTPEIGLHLITRECPLWSSKIEDDTPFQDPFWAFYWPGGQAMTRYILDNVEIFKHQTVLDVGCGCGASSIAASMVGAKRVVANDIDSYAIVATELNAAVNHVNLETSQENLIGNTQSDWSIVLLGDMFYDETFRDILVQWTTKLYHKFKTNVFIGDPGRLPLLNHPIRDSLTKVAEYDLSNVSKEENYGLSTGYVWKLDVR